MHKLIFSLTQKLFSIIIVLALVNPMGPIAGFAQDIEMEDLFDVVSKQTVRTATLSPIPVSESPGAVSIITSEEIERYGASTLDEVIALLPGADIRMMNMGFAGTIRGFGGSPFQEGMHLQLDGLLYNSSDKGGSSMNPGYSSFPLPLSMIKQVEIIREPISALYGPNAFYGVVNVITKNGKDINGGTASLRASNKSNGRDLQKYDLLLGGGTEDYDWIVSGDFTKQMGVMRFNEDNKFKDGTLATKLSYKNLKLTWFSRKGSNDPFVFGNPLDGTSERVKQYVNLVGVTYDQEVTDRVSVTAKSSYLSRFGTNCQVCHNPNGFLSTDSNDDNEYFYRIYEQAHVTISPDDKNQFTLGAEFIYDQEHMDAGILTEPRAANRTFSGLLQYVRKLREDLKSTVGVRQDHTTWSKRGALTSPRALLVYTPTENTVIRTGYTRAHRVPTFHERFLFMKFLPRKPGTNKSQPVGGSNLFIMGNPELRPETIDTFSIGGDQWISRNFNVKVNGFYSVVSNMIDRKQLSSKETIALLPDGKLPDGSDPVTKGFEGAKTRASRWINNPANAKILGGELEFRYRPYKSLDLNFNYGYKVVTFTSDLIGAMGSAQPPNAPRHLLGGGITSYPVKDLMINVTGRYRSKFFGSHQMQVLFLDDFSGSLAAPDVFFLDFHVRYTLRYGLKLSLIGRNMLNQDGPDTILPIDPRLATGKDIFVRVAYDFGGYKR